MVGDPGAIGGLVTVSQRDTRISDDQSLWQRARETFASSNAVVLGGFLDSSLLTWVRARAAEGQFRLKVHAASGDEECMANNEAIWMLRFLLGASSLLRAVESITGAWPLTKCQVRIYRFLPDSGQRHDWHDDVGEGRRLGLSINLSEDTFAGGNLQVRERASGRVTADVRNCGAGDAVIFRLGRDLEHQVLPVTGRVARTAVAGWFRE